MSRTRLKKLAFPDRGERKTTYWVEITARAKVGRRETREIIFRFAKISREIKS